jgi:hypothetical protein
LDNPQLDTRYFKGLEGQYTFNLNFLLQEEDAPAGEHIARARGSASDGDRSVSVEVELEAGRYEVLPKIVPFEIRGKPAVEDVVKGLAEKQPQKLRQIGLNYDLAHAKGDSESEDRMGEGRAMTEETENQQTCVPEDPNSAYEAYPSTGASAPQAEAQNGEWITEEEDSARHTPPAKAVKKSRPGNKCALWNAVCVIGLRVYSKGAGVSITFARPRDAEEGAVLDVDGATPAGATM